VRGVVGGGVVVVSTIVIPVRGRRRVTTKPWKSAARRSFSHTFTTNGAFWNPGCAVIVRLELDDAQIEAIAQRAAEIVLAGQRPTSPYLTPSEAAELIRAPRSRIYDVISADELQPIRDGRRVLLHRDHVLAYIESRPA
jgi:excisionase family DNA binding protein